MSASTREDSREAGLTASSYIKVAMIMSVLCIAVVFWLVYRLLQVPAEQQRAVALQASQLVATAAPVAATPAGSATPVATASSGVFAIANAYPNVHTAAGLSTSKVGVVNRGDRVEVIGRTADSVWLQIRYPAAPNGVGWVSADLMTVTTTGGTIPVVTSP